ncbi:hypothetical protein [Neobacillus dielmonensis]|uniref:hypothetical protein n=1 Tax=Neobacillus dielmonensis TaxID=1347369 RepID=UPI0005AA8953|nr:hypothetical protein [Neobacillus dielmonensis]
MDKITCIAYLLYNSSRDQNIKNKAIQLLNGDVSIRDLKREPSLQTHIAFTESFLKKNKIDKNQVQQFAEEFLVLEV